MAELVEDNNSGAKVVVPEPSGKGIRQEIVEPDTVMKEVVQNHIDEIVKDLQPKPAKKIRTKKTEVKTGSAAELIQVLENNIEMIRYVESIVTLEIPKIQIVKARELVIGMVQSIENIKSETLKAIQKL